MRFQMSPLGERLQMYAFSMKTIVFSDRFSVDAKPKRIEMYAFSNENALLWTGPQYCHFGNAGSARLHSKGYFATSSPQGERGKRLFGIPSSKLLNYSI